MFSPCVISVRLREKAKLIEYLLERVDELVLLGGIGYLFKKALFNTKVIISLALIDCCCFHTSD